VNEIKLFLEKKCWPCPEFMKIVFRLLTLQFYLALAFCVWTPAALADAETNNLPAAIVQARTSGDADKILGVLPDVENLWPQQPEAYFQCMKDFASTLRGMSSQNPEAKQALLVVYEHTLQKPCPDDLETATACLEPKWAVTMTCLDVVDQNRQKPLVIDLAKFIGEVRSRMIAGYFTTIPKQRPDEAEAILKQAEVKNPNYLTDVKSAGAYERAMEDYQQNLSLTNKLQVTLLKVDRTLSMRLFQLCFHFLSEDPQNAGFLTEVASAAHLTEVEQQHLAAIHMPAMSRAASESLTDTNLVWDSETKAINIIAGESEAHFTFNFTNISSGNVTILGVHPSCGCTTAQLPPVPWVIQPGTNGQIGIKVNIVAKNGTLSKTIAIGTDKGSTMLLVKINILPPTKETTMSDADRTHNLAAAQVDRQAVFHGDCASCHVKPGDGKFGEKLYDADCAICHEGENRATMVPDLHAIKEPTNVEFWRQWITHGKPGTLMPAFVITEGGPLTDAQIDRLAHYINSVIPSK
jgi:hypothetical protein